VTLVVARIGYERYSVLLAWDPDQVYRLNGTIGGPIELQARVQTQGNNHKVQLRWSPADGRSVNLLRNGVVRGTTADDGKATDNLGTHTGTFTYQVCETDTAIARVKSRSKFRNRNN